MPNPVTKREAEYQYYTRKCAANGIVIQQNAPLVDFKRAFYTKVLGGDSGGHEQLSDLEFKWLGTLSGVSGTTLQDRWREAVAGLHATGLKPSNDLGEDQTMFFIAAP